MAQLNGRFIKKDTVTGSKIKLDNDEYLRSKNNSGDDINILKVDATNNVVFSIVPQASGVPAANSDLCNKEYVDGKVSGAAVIGNPTDGSYTDGLLDFTSTTSTADAVDTINETLKYLAPEQGYIFSDIDGSPSFTVTGTSTYATPKVVGSYANPLTGVTYESTDTNGGSRSDFINDNTFTLTTPTISSVGFRNADKGTLTFNVNGSSQGVVDLGSSFVEAERSTGQTGVPFTNGKLSVTRVSPTNSFPLWQDGTAIGTLDATEIVSGYNYTNMIHNPNGTNLSSQTLKYWYSATTTPSATSASLNGAGAGSNQPNASTSTKTISGVTYYSAGTYNNIGLTVSGIYGTSYYTYDTNITSTILTTGINISTPTPTVSSGAVTNPTHTITGQSASILTSKRVLLGETLGITCTPYTNYGTTYATGATTASVSNILVDSYTAAATNTFEDFIGEVKRYNSSTDFNSLSLTPNWTTSESIANAGNSGYNDGLLIYGDTLRYPSLNFTTITAPSAGPDYSGCTGRRYYIREFYNAAGKQNFSLQLNGISGSDLSNTSGSGIYVQMALPTQTVNGSGTFEFKDCLTAWTGDTSIGCMSGDAPTGSNPTITFTAGQKSTANSAGKVIVKISMPEGSTKQISSLTFTFIS